MLIRQADLPGTSQPLDIAQEAALLFAEAQDEAACAKERADERKEDMIRAAAKLGVDTIKIRVDNVVHTYLIENKTTVKHSSYAEVAIEKAKDDLQAR